MSSTYISITIIFLSMCAATGRAQEPIFYQPEQMQADLEKFRTALIEIHPGTYTHQSKEEFDQMMNDLMLQTAKPMEATAFYKIVLRLIANIHDGHTQAYTFGKLGSVLYNQKQLPFQVYVRDERIFIVKNMSSLDIPEGSEILSIDDVLSDEIIREILEHYSSDGTSHSGMQHWLGGPYRSFPRLYSEVFGEHNTYNLVYRNYKTKQIIETKIEAISKEEYKSIESEKYPEEETANEAFSFEINDKRNYAYLKINSFVKNGFDDPENIYPDFYKKCFNEISDRKIKNLIIDLRNNGGGKASNAAYLLQYFINESITPAKEIVTLGDDEYFLEKTGETLNLNESFGLEQKQDNTFRVTKIESLRDLMSYDPIEEFHFTGKLVVLINGGTTSAAGIAAGLLKEHTNADLVGSETYGYAGISNGVRQISIKGDHTETAIYLPLLHTKFSVSEHNQNRSVVPDYQVSNSIHDILESNDSAFEFVLNKLLLTTN